MKESIKKLLGYFGYRVEGTRYTPRHLFQPECVRTLDFHDVICRYMFEHGPVCNFIQIGAYDGISTDPLHRYIERCGWRGIMLEPQPGPAEQLRQLYKGNPKIVVIEAALDSKRMTRTLYTVEGDALPKWTGGMASFERKPIMKEERWIPDLKKYIRELQVECIPVSEVLELRPSKGPLDLLQIDAEGADGRILSQFPFECLKPAIVHWEIKHMTKLEQEAVLDLLCFHGYLISRSSFADMLAVQKPH